MAKFREQVPKQIIYMVGMMRSGSTLVGEYLGSFGESVCAGELINTWRSAARGQYCSCGSAPIDCVVWQQVFDGESARRDAKLDDIRRLVDRPRRIPQFLYLRNRSEGSWPSEVRTYVEQLRMQAAKLAQATEASVLIDTSKSPAGLALAILAFGSRVTALQVIRDPRAVAHSESRHLFKKEGVHGDIPRYASCRDSAISWRKLNLEGALAGHFAESWRPFVYESLGQSPRLALEQLAGDLGLASDPPKWHGSKVELRQQHILAGNPSRAGDRHRAVHLTNEWISDLTVREQRAVSFRTIPLYNYWQRKSRRSNT